MTASGGGYGEIGRDETAHPAPWELPAAEYPPDYPSTNPGQPVYPPAPCPPAGAPGGYQPTEYGYPSGGYGQPVHPHYAAGYNSPYSPYPPANPPQYAAANPSAYIPPYPSPNYNGGYGQTSPGANSLAIASLVTSIVGLILGIPLAFSCGIGLLIPIIGTVLGIVALNQINRTQQPGRGIAIAGIAVGGCGIVIMLIAVVLVVAALTTHAH